ncbi:MAG: flagellar export protein FliJ, partial [Asticcacaulis sp.]
ATLDAECEIECVKASMDPHLSRHLPAFKRGVKLRRDTLSAELDLIVHEENGVRDSLSNAFEDLKKFEHVAEVTRLNRIKAEQKIENAQMDESALRASAGRKRA